MYMPFLIGDIVRKLYKNIILKDNELLFTIGRENSVAFQNKFLTE